ncbi:M23 family metallopeptidase [Candidatus Puniceispirillum sp.]|nr:M23 family metallopeptidase [Candidatus Puniceispirillum sp.]
MAVEGKKISKLVFNNLVKRLNLANLSNRFFPDMRRGNQPDMPTTTTDRLWFLSENRFLFFTRGGPVEVTLKPSFVLGGILICMAGVATIFYSTLIASYSAIEVIRDETIQTARASSTSNVEIKPHIALSRARVITWQPYQLSASRAKQPYNITDKHPQPFHENSDSPNYNNPQTPNYGATTEHKIIDEMPMIINGGKRITLGSEAKNSISKSNSTQTSSVEDLKSDLDSPIQESKYDAIEQHMDTAVKAKIKTPTAQKKPISSEGGGNESLVTRAQEFAIALLPSFDGVLNPSKTIQQKTDKKNTSPIAPISLDPPLPYKLSIYQQKNKIEPRDFSGNKTKTIVPENGLTSDAQITQDGPVLPIITKAARTKKMLLSFQQEIDYIRSIVSKLGISQEVLPAPRLIKSQLSDNEFQSMMINLAEHRAALRKIPFKPPMLHFYISSEYGKRRHPKTGKITFHHGIDLAGTWQENVRVTAPGTIIFAGKEGSFGKVVRVQHEYGVATTYAHLARITVKNGDYVSENHIIGKMGNTGKSAGAHLHYEIRVNRESINPNHFMTIGRQISVAGELRQSALAE